MEKKRPYQEQLKEMVSQIYEGYWQWLITHRSDETNIYIHIWYCKDMAVTHKSYFKQTSEVV